MWSGRMWKCGESVHRPGVVGAGAPDLVTGPGVTGPALRAPALRAPALRAPALRAPALRARRFRPRRFRPRRFRPRIVTRGNTGCRPESNRAVGQPRDGVTLGLRRGWLAADAAQTGVL